MEPFKTTGLGGVIFSSQDPDRLAKFYREVIGLPLELNSHGGLQEHWECDFQGIHFAVMAPWGGEGQREPSSAIIPSFVVADIQAFIDHHKLQTLHPIMKLDEGKYVVTIADVDGNAIRLWMDEQA